MGVYKDKKRGTWFVKTKYCTKDGGSRWLTKRGFTRKSDALEWEHQYFTNYKSNCNTTFSEFAEIYIKNKLCRLKASTAVPLERIIRNRLVPYFGNVPLDRIEPMAIAKWQNLLIYEMSARTGKKLKQSYIKKLNASLSAMLNYAKKCHLIEENPMERSEKISGADAEMMHFWTLEQYFIFEKAAKEDPAAHLIFDLLYWTGMREGEMRALTKSDFDFDEMTVKITKTLHTQNSVDIVTSPKTQKANRTIVMPEFLAKEMREYIDKNSDLDDDSRIFFAPPYYLQRKMRAICKKAGMDPIRIHDLRHSHVSLLIYLHFSAVDIAERLGHESVDITFKYAHLFPSEQIEMAKDLDSIRKGDVEL